MAELPAWGGVQSRTDLRMGGPKLVSKLKPNSTQLAQDTDMNVTSAWMLLWVRCVGRGWGVCEGWA